MDRKIYKMKILTQRKLAISENVNFKGRMHWKTRDIPHYKKMYSSIRIYKILNFYALNNIISKYKNQKLTTWKEE